MDVFDATLVALVVGLTMGLVMWLTGRGEVETEVSLEELDDALES